MYTWGNHEGLIVKVVKCVTGRHDLGKFCVCDLVGQRVVVEDRLPDTMSPGGPIYTILEYDKVIKAAEFEVIR